MPLARVVGQSKSDCPKAAHEGDRVWELDHKHTMALLPLRDWGQEIWFPNPVFLIVLNPSVMVEPLLGGFDLIRIGILEILIEDLLGPPGGVAIFGLNRCRECRRELMRVAG